MSRLSTTARRIKAALQQFVTAGNRLAWSDLGGALIGGIVYQLFTGAIAIPLGVADALATLLGDIQSALALGGTSLAATLTGQADAAWDPLVAGIFTTPLNLAVVLATVAIGVYGLREVLR